MATATARMVISGEDRTKKAFQSVQSSLGNLNKSFGSLKTGLGAVLGIGGIGAFITQMASSADKIGKVSAKLGVSTDALQKFRFGAEQSGVSASTFDMALQRMTRRVAEARDGTGEAKKALKEMGISLKDSSGKAKTTEQIFMEVADVMQGMESQSDKVRLAFKLFDSEGVSLVNMLQQGSGAIKGFGDQLERYGGIIDKEAIKASEDFNDALNLLSKTSAVVFTPLIKGLTFVMRGWKNWIDFFTKEDPDPFKLTNKSIDELKTRLHELEETQKGYFERQKDLDSKIEKSTSNIARSALSRSLEQVTAKMTKNLLEREFIEERILKLSKGTKTEKQNESKWLGISLKQQEKYTAELDREFGTSKEVLKLQKSKVEEHKKLKKILELEVDEYIRQEDITNKTSKTWYAIIEGIDGSKHKVSGLTREQAESLAKANKLTRETELYSEAVKKAKRAQEGVSAEIQEQKDKVEKQNEQQKTLMGWVGSFSNTFKAIIDSISFKLDESTGKLMMTGFSWQQFGLSILMSSPKIQRTMQSLFGFVDKAVEDLLPGLSDTSKRAEEMARRAEEIAQEVNSMTSAIEDFALQINNSNAEMLALAEIEKVYQDRVKKAQELDATHLIYLADVEKSMATLGYRVGVLRNATQAFAQSVTQFLDAVSTEGFTLYQKQLFSMLKGFERGTQKAFLDLISASDKIIDATPLQPDKMKKAFEELQKYMQMYVAGDIRGILDQKLRPEDIAKRHGLTMEQLEDPVKGMFDEFRRVIKLGGIGSHTADYFRSVTEKYLPVIAGAITSMDSQINAYNEAVQTKSKAETQMATALKGLTIMIKDTIQTEFEAGKSKAELKIDLDALSAQFSSLGIDIKELKTFIDALEATQPSGAMGGMVKRYPYGGSIEGPSHAGGGVNANLEGGEYVMRKSSVSKYGQGFMNAVNTGRFSMGQPIQVSIYDGTGQAIDEYDSAIRFEINQRANRFNEFPALAN